MKFGNLYIGDMFNTKTARYVKTSATQAIVVLSSLFDLGVILDFSPDEDVVVLYTGHRP